MKNLILLAGVGQLVLALCSLAIPRVLRWKEALDAGIAPPVVLQSTHERALEFVTLAQLQAHAVQKVG